MTEPPDTGVTLPTPLSMEAVVAPELVQVSVEVLPGAMGVGLAENDPVGGAT